MKNKCMKAYYYLDKEFLSTAVTMYEVRPIAGTFAKNVIKYLLLFILFPDMTTGLIWQSI